MRILSAIIAFLAGLALVGFGIDRLTAETEETNTVETEGAEDAPFTVITDDVIDAADGRDEFTIEAEGEYLIAVGRTYDIEAWLDDAAHNRITGFEASEDPEQPSHITAEFIDGETDVPNPTGSDLWVSVENAEGEMPYRWDTPDEAGDWALLIYREDLESAPNSITTTETVTFGNDGGVWMIIGGALLVLLSLVLFYWAVGTPRRKRRKAENAAAVAPAEKTTESSANSAPEDQDAASAEEEDGRLNREETATGAETAEEAEAEETAAEAPASAPAWVIPSVETGKIPAVEDEEPEDPEQNDQPTEAVPAYTEENDDAAQAEEAAEAPDAQEAETEDRDENDDEDQDPPASSAADEGRTEKLSGWAQGLRDRLGRGKSPFTAVLAMLVALAAGLGLSGPAYADEEDQSENGQTEEAEDEDSAEEQEETGRDEEPEGTEDPDQEEDAPDQPDPEELEEETEAEAEVEAEEIPSEGYSVLLSSQLDRILEDVAETVAAGDEEQDVELLEDRVAGEALEYRELAYRNHDLAEIALPHPIGTEVLSAVVSGDPEFPRQAMVIVEEPESESLQILFLEQTTARENYKLVHSTMMAPGTEFPTFSAEQGGITVADPGDAEDEDSPARVLRSMSRWFVDDGHDFGDQVAESLYIEALHEYHEELSEAAEDTEINFPNPAVDYEDLSAIELPDGTLVLAGSFDMTMEMSPISDGDTIFLDHDLVIEMVGTDWTTFDTQITSREFVVIQIPPADSEEEIVLIGVDNLIADANIDTPDWFDDY
ncbi:hypothetical protein [Nesterenkonia ebinurensis]|uniref:hypothetical protein n=1 Tax=Nesterenkonia ebinurensis TaxID=2608252 RepID=UPI00123D3DBE|nr:hypothetical protein [Nesterenkonia ebinurensis]